MFHASVTAGGLSLLKPEHRTTPASALAGRCGIYQLFGTSGDVGKEFDLAVVKLSRPIAYEALESTSDISAGAVFENWMPLVDDPATFAPTFDGIAVGFGGTGTRGVRALTNLTYSANLISRTMVLTGGDSGGPLFAPAAGGPAVIAVAVTAQSWVTLASGKLAWVRDAIDENGDGRMDTACGTLIRGASATASAVNDQDGDGYLDTEDSCPNTYNPCQLNTDFDGDGTPDDCDACPTSAAIAGLRGQITPDNDGDGIPNACDCGPSTSEFIFETDDDHDWVTA